MTAARELPGKLSKCRVCAAPLVWALTEKGKRVACDLEPSAAGDFFLFRRQTFIEAFFRTSAHPSAHAARARGDKLYTSHFTTCPERKRRARA